MPQKLAKLTDSPATLITVTSLLLTLTLGWIFERQQSAVIETRTEHYGQSLSNLAAAQARQFLLNNDLISLQVMLEELVEKPDVIETVVFDVENQRLVEAGNSSSHTDYGTAYTAPITLDNSLAGYVQVTIGDQQLMASHNSLWFTAILVILAAALALQLISYKVKPYKEDKDDSPPPANQLLLEFQFLRPNPQNWGRFQQCLEFLNKLYGGEIQSLSTSSATMSFPFDAEGEAQFRALCTAILAHQINDDLIDFSIVRVASENEPVNEKKKLTEAIIESLSSLQNQGIVIEPKVINSTVESRLRAEILSLFREQTGGDAYLQIPIDCLQSKFADLLARQQEQMKRIGRA